MSECQLTMVLCAYGENCFLESAAKSLAEQSVPVKLIMATSTPCEYIENIARRFGFEYCVNPVRGGGIGADWEFAASCADSEYVTIAHQDDIYFPEYAERVLRAMKKSPDSLIVFTDNCDLVNGKYIKHRSYLLIKRLLLWAYYLKRSWRSKIFKRLTCCFGNAICCPSVTYNIGQCGKLSFDKSLKCVLDWWKWLELSGQKGAFTYIATVLMAHRIDDTTTTSALIHSNRRYEEDLHVFSLIWGQRIARLLMKFYSRSYKMADSKRIGK